MLKIKACAKINLTLDILGKRPDGYHEVAMIMQSIALHDDLTIEKAEKDISLTIDGEEIPDLPADKDNLICKAAELMIKEYDIKSGVNIRLKKRIPIAAGLAGGSADAAAVFLGLNELFSLNLATDALCSLGAEIGSDVPFCIMGGTYLATGRGEVLRKMPDLPKMSLILAKPKISISTPWAYKRYDELKKVTHIETSAMEEAIAKKNTDAIFSLMGNVLEPVVSAEHGEIDEYKSIMLEAGAKAAQMTGSGPTVFAFAENDPAAKKIARVMREKTIADVFVTSTV